MSIPPLSIALAGGYTPATVLSDITSARATDVAPEMISRWSKGRLGFDRATFTLLSTLVLEKLEGLTTTAEKLRGTHKLEPRARPLAPMRLKLRHA